MYLPRVNPDRFFPTNPQEWLRSEQGVKVFKGCSLIVSISFIAFSVIRSSLCLMPACIMSGFFLGALVKKRLVLYNYSVNFFCDVYAREGSFFGLRVLILGVIVAASRIFPVHAAMAAIVAGVYCGLLY